VTVTAVFFYDVVRALHVAAAILAFGVVFTYPVIGKVIRSRDPRAVPALHAAQAHLSRFFITPAMAVLLAAGIYLASDRDYWDQTWVTVPLVILLVLFGLVGGFFAPRERRLAELAQRDVDAAQGGEVKFSEEYETLANSWAAVGGLAGVLVLVAVFFMVAKPFAG
jgi:uncharacterized membrane protein